MTFDDLINKLTDHLSPRPSEIAKRFRFHKREQTVGETVAVYIAELRRLAIHCDKTLKDRLVCGLKQEHIQKKLLVEPNLTLEKNYTDRGRHGNRKSGHRGVAGKTKTRGHKQTSGETETRYVRETETENSVETCQCDTGEMLPLWWRPQGKDLQTLKHKV